MPFPETLDESLRDSYTVTGFIYDLYDGDTVYYHASLGYFQWAVFQVGRLLGIDAPELRGESRSAGERSRSALWSMVQKYALNRHQPIRLGIGFKFKIRSRPASDKHFDQVALAEREKYGRWLIEILGADDEGRPVSLNQLMLRDGFAREYLLP